MSLIFHSLTQDTYILRFLGGKPVNTIREQQWFVTIAGADSTLIQLGLKEKTSFAKVLPGQKPFSFDFQRKRAGLYKGFPFAAFPLLETMRAKQEASIIMGPHQGSFSLTPSDAPMRLRVECKP